MSRLTLLAGLLVSPLAIAGDPPEFPAATAHAENVVSRKFTVADANLDGLPDVIFTGGLPGFVGLVACLPGSGGGRLAEQVNSTGGPLITLGELNGLPTVADFNGDGLPDVVVPGYSDLGTLAGEGDGHFTPVASQPFYYPQTAPIALDANADGDLDLAIVQALDGDKVLQVLTGAGDGSFALAASLPQVADGLRGGDLDLDGDTDLVTWTGNTVQVNYVGGPFLLTAGPSVTAPSAVRDAAVAQVVGSAHPDIVLANIVFLSATSVVRNFGGTSFVAMPGQADDAGWDRLMVGDVSGDGAPDLVGVSIADWDLRVRSGIGGGSFGPSAKTPFFVNAKWALADMDLDGHMDVVATLGSNLTSNADVAVLRGQAPGVIQLHDTLDNTLSNIEDMVLRDFDGDGLQDLAVVGLEMAGLRAGDGEGHLGELVPATGLFPIAARKPLPLDLEGDGDTDLVVSWQYYGIASYRNTTALQLEQAQVLAYGTGYDDLVAADFDGDGMTDLLLSRSGSSTLSFAKNAAGTFLGPVAFPSPQPASRIEAGDVDGDGDLDLVGQVYPGPDPWHSRQVVLRNDSVGFTFTATQTLDLTSDFAVADLDGDGFADVVAACNYTGALLSHADGAGGLSAPEVIGPVETNVSVDVADYDMDGHPDVALNTETLGQQLVFGDGAGSWQPGPRTFVAGWPSALASGDLDGDGHRDLVVAYDSGIPQEPRPLSFVHPLPPATWTALPAGKPGAAGVPTLMGTGTLQPATAMTLALAQAKPLAPVTLILGLSKLDQPFKGGLLVPSPDVIVVGLASNGAGQLVLPATWPSGLPSGLSLWFQAWVTDGSATHGLAASTGLRALTP